MALKDEVFKLSRCETKWKYGGMIEALSPEKRQVQERQASTLKHMQIRMGHDQVSGGTSVLCLLAAPVAYDGLPRRRIDNTE